MKEAAPEGENKFGVSCTYGLALSLGASAAPSAQRLCLNDHHE